ncbi:hypothetical protein NX059_003806 [Plenodomus lindquistii]|nr:hypothetical protein NX059_003806 [Plenodomus lindquistii]
MAKKKNKKSSKQVEVVAPPDSAPLPPPAEPVPDEPVATSLTAEAPTTDEAQASSDAQATEASSVEPSQIEPEAPPLEAEVAKAVVLEPVEEVPTPVPAEDPDALQTDPNEQLSANNAIVTADIEPAPTEEQAAVTQEDLELQPTEPGEAIAEESIQHDTNPVTQIPEEPSQESQEAPPDSRTEPEIAAETPIHTDASDSTLTVTVERPVTPMGNGPQSRLEPEIELDTPAMPGALPTEPSPEADLKSTDNTESDGAAEPEAAASIPVVEEPLAPEIPSADDTVVTAPPEAPEAPEVPETSAATEVPEAPEAPEVAEAPEVSEIPEVPKAPEVPEAPEVPDVPEALETTVPPDAPEVPDTSDVPEVLEASETAEPPEAPPVDTDAPAEEPATQVNEHAEEAESAAVEQESKEDEENNKLADEEELKRAAQAIADAQKEIEAQESKQQEESERLESEKAEQEIREEQNTTTATEVAEQAEQHEGEGLQNEAEVASGEAAATGGEPTIPISEEEAEHREPVLEDSEQERLEAEARIASEAAKKALKEAEEAEATRIAAEEALREPTTLPASDESEHAPETADVESISTRQTSTAETDDVQKTHANAVPDIQAHESARVLSPEPLSGAEVDNGAVQPARAPAPPAVASPPPSLSGPRWSYRDLESPHSRRVEAPKRRSRDSDPIYAPRPHAVAQLIEDNRPPAPSPPIGRAHLRQNSAFDSEDESDSALIRSRRHPRGGETHDTSRGPTFGPAPAHRGGFASRVPVEPPYANPPPPPPGYHPRYYAPPAPPYYQNPGHGMSQPGYPSPHPYGPSSHSSSSPYQESWNQYPPGYPPYGSPHQRHDSSGSRDYPVHAIENGSADDDSGDVFSRIAQAIPDLHVLLAKYKETHSQLSVREDLLRRASVEQEAKIRAKDEEIEDLRDEIDNLDTKHSAEVAQLRFQIDNLREQVKDLRELKAKTEKENEAARVARDAAMKSWEAKYKELEDAHAKAWKDFDDWKSASNTKNDAEKIALAIQFDKKLKEADMLAEKQRQEAAAVFMQEKEELRAEHQRQLREREASFEQVRAELEHKLGAAQIDREEALKYERESREVWFAERENLTKAHLEDRDSLQQAWQEQRDLLEFQYQKAKDESDRAWTALHAGAARKAEEERARADQLARENEELMMRFAALKEESQKEKDVIKSVAMNIESEKSRLEKLMECYGDIAEIKSKGDNYYLVSFSQLQKQIVDLASTHFMHLPVRPPAEDLAQVPSNLPSFLGDTTASRQVRAAYIAHTVSKLITYRVFGPFLFSLGTRYDKADSLFSSMSNHIRAKSTRKEAIWRQQTLLAAFTSSGAKQRINTAAGTVVEEIVNAIKHFADPKEEDNIKIAVKRIVKVAAETWRFARLEREMITAVMPALEDQEHSFNGPEYWGTYKPEGDKPEGTLIGSLDSAAPQPDEHAQLLLRLFPVIYREPKHENFHRDGEEHDTGCTFHHGLALYSDADAVVARTEELRSAGLPPYTTVSTSPSAEHGKFPPPACPPPREPLPSPPAHRRFAPETAIEASEIGSLLGGSKSPPPSPPKPERMQRRKKSTPPPPPSSIPSFDDSTPYKPVTAYRRPPPGTIDFASPRNLIGVLPPVESLAPPSSFSRTSVPLPGSRSQNSLKSRKAPPGYPPPPPPEMSQETLPEPSPMESAVLPESYSQSTFDMDSTIDGPDTWELPTPPHSRCSSPERTMSPLFEAVDEIDELQSVRSSRPTTASSRRRSTHTRRSVDITKDSELPDITPVGEGMEAKRRSSTYALSHRSTKSGDSDRTEKTSKSERTEKSSKSGRNAKSHYLCESRSAAVKALYPDGPLAGRSADGSSKGGSVKNEKKRDRDSRDSTKESTRDSARDSVRDLRELRSQISTAFTISDNGTWDTNSQSRMSEEANPPTTVFF